MLIIVDQNEKDTNPKVFELLKRSFSNVIVANLPHREHGGVKVTAGDINIPLDDGSLLAIERKTPHDFLQSIASGHLFHQVEVMSKHAKYSQIIVTGGFSYTDKSDMVKITGEEKVTNWKGPSVRAAIRAIEYSGCPIDFCPPHKYGMLIAEAYATVNKDDKRQSVSKNRIITFPPVDARIEFLAQLPGVGMNKATALLKFAGMMDKNADEDGFGTIASALHWMSILVQIDKKERPKGWGAELILMQRKFFGYKSNQYLGLISEIETPSNKKKEVNIALEINGKRYEEMPF